MNKNNLAYSVLMSVYFKEKPEALEESLGSMLAQTVAPFEFVIVEDGPLTDELNQVLDNFQRSCCSSNVVRKKLLKNQGLGKALSIGVIECSCELIVRMDSDDYSLPDRVEKQLELFRLDPALALVGSWVGEFYDGSDKDKYIKVVLPIENDEIALYSKRRNPFRHPSVVFRKSAAMDVGNYSEDMLFFEDWDLFNRMLRSGYKAHNIPEYLVRMRVDRDFYIRRGGFSYCRHMYHFKTNQYKTGYFTLYEYLKTVVPHTIVCLAPNSVRNILYKNFLRGDHES